MFSGIPGIPAPVPTSIAVFISLRGKLVFKKRDYQKWDQLKYLHAF